MTPELKTAYHNLETAIADIARLDDDFEGVITEWVLVAACQRYDDDGDSTAWVGTLLPDGGGNTPYHRILGLLDYALTRSRAAILTPDE